LALAACFAAFSARRFCFEEEGGIAVGEQKNESVERSIGRNQFI
jgi:hypothetical protein